MRTFDAEGTGPGNRLLIAMSDECLDWLRPRLTTVTMVNGQVMHERGRVIEHVFRRRHGSIGSNGRRQRRYRGWPCGPGRAGGRRGVAR